MACSTTMTTIKLTDGKDIRRFTIDTVTYAAVSARAKEAFGLDDDTKFTLQYKDDEGDLISMSSQEEMDEVLSQQPPPKILRLTIKKLNPKKGQQANTPKDTTPNKKDTAAEAEADAPPPSDLPPPLAKLLADLAQTSPELVPVIRAALKEQPFLAPMLAQLAETQPHLVQCGAEMLRNLCAGGACGMVPPGCGFGGFGGGFPGCPPPAAAAGDATNTKTAADAADAESTEELHSGVVCDKSGMSPIVGPRWHLVGRNYDLCQEEYDKLPAEEKVNFERVAAQHCMPHRKFGGWCGRGGGGGGD